MTKRLTRIAPLKTGIVVGVLYALLGLVAVPFLMLVGASAAAIARHGASTGLPAPATLLFGVGALFLPIFYGVIGFLIGVIGAAIYNLVARWTGGIEFSVEDVVYTA